MIQPAKEVEIFPASQAGVEALVGAGVVAELPAHGARRRSHFMSRDGNGA